MHHPHLSSKSHPYSDPPPATSLSPLRTLRALPRKQSNLAQVTAGLGTSSPIEARQNSPLRGTGSTHWEQSEGKPSLQVLGNPHEDQAVHLVHMCGVLRSRACMLFVGVSVSEGPQALLVFWWSPYTLRVPQSFPQLFHKA